MRIKPGVSIHGLKPEMNVAMQIAEGVWGDEGKELVVTAGTDGKHSATSRHYIGMALDFRSRYFTAKEKKRVVDSLRKRLGPEFKVVVHKTHIHVHYTGTAI